MKVLTNELSLSYPPISNQEGEWLWEDREVREYVKTSKLYMIGHRKELFFYEAQIKFQKFGFIKFRLKLGDILSPQIKMSIKFVFDHMAENCDNDSEITLGIGDKFFKIVDETNNKILYWTTPDKFLFDFSRKNIDVETDDKFDFRQFSIFDLYYVGISKSGDSFSRLYEKAHHGRLRVLTNETQKGTSARLTDELMIFLFEIDSMNINIANDISDIDDIFHQSNETAIVADAEKAFIKLMSTKYNQVKYTNYPKGLDGLYSSGLHRYGYSINEDISFKTKALEFNGARGITAKKDLVLIENDKINIIQLYHN